jgi:hypothetical protein
VKNNLGPPAPSLRWKLVSTDSGAARVEWLGPTDHSADALLADSAEAPSERGALQAACTFLQELLAEGEVAATVVSERAHEVGISARTLERAKRHLCIRHRKQHGTGRFLWFLPATREQPLPSAGPAAVADMAELADMAEIADSPSGASPNDANAERAAAATTDGIEEIDL